MITNMKTGFRQMISEKSEEMMNSTKSMKSDSSQTNNLSISKSGGYHQNCSQKGSPKSPFQNKLNVDSAHLSPLNINPKQMGPGQDILLSQIQPNSPVTQISLFQESAKPKILKNKPKMEYSKVVNFDISQIRGSRMKKGKIIKNMTEEEVHEKINEED